MAGIMGKDAYIKVWRKAEVLEKELDYEKARNKTLIKEVTADCETIKARDAKIEELKLEVEKWKTKLEHTVAMYEEEANAVEEKYKEEAYRFDQAQDRISELELELDILRSKNRNMEGAVNEAIGLAATNAQYLQRIEELEEEVNMFASESYNIEFPSSEMKTVTSLIVDMTLNGATKEEIDRVVKYSAAVMDAARDYGIGELRTKYQGEMHE